LRWQLQQRQTPVAVAAWRPLTCLRGVPVTRPSAVPQFQAESALGIGSLFQAHCLFFFSWHLHPLVSAKAQRSMRNRAPEFAGRDRRTISPRTGDPRTVSAHGWRSEMAENSAIVPPFYRGASMT
jgi:hypothetical protein